MGEKFRQSGSQDPIRRLEQGAQKSVSVSEIFKRHQEEDRRIEGAQMVIAKELEGVYEELRRIELLHALQSYKDGAIPEDARTLLDTIVAKVKDIRERMGKAANAYTNPNDENQVLTAIDESELINRHWWLRVRFSDRTPSERKQDHWIDKIDSRFRKYGYPKHYVWKQTNL